MGRRCLVAGLIASAVVAVPGVTATAATAATAAAPSVRLTIVTDTGARDATLLHTTSSLRCHGKRARGTGYLQPRARARAACRQVRGNAVERVLRRRRRPAPCTQVYGGPQEAVVTGRIGSRDVDLEVGRSDGCGIADWRALEPLLGDPERTS